ncbi:MAG: hypothetical protein FJ088_16690 [Deltaproteobacteria bacterium]|nr:hypothetical protein [Deltaproteobacteria bacterium]
MAVIERIILMGTTKGDLVVDLMSGAGTSAVAAYNNERFSIICDISEEYTAIAEKRLGIRRLALADSMLRATEEATTHLRAKRFRMPFRNGRLTEEPVVPDTGQLTLLMK